MSQHARVVAVLGPTNTGKTTYAIDRMLAYRTGVIGLPLRLLAREIYDRIVSLRGPSVVALVTGEERIVPPRTQYWVCTVEAMPEGMGCDFLAVDEIQLCADPERGHVFTDRLLRARGLHETLFLGADTMRGPIAELVPEAQFMRRERMSTLLYTGSRKTSRMPARSAVVGFSVDSVYAMAELLRRQKGGAAVVMGALSPRTRNAQVAMYQAGEVDYLVATDAIGMGLNLDVHHVAFSALSKFDGRRMRPLAPNELAQIAGRAGRGQRDGSFGVTGDAPQLDEGVAQAIMDHRFAPLRKLIWRNSDLEFGSITRLTDSLERQPEQEMLVRARDADDLIALKALSQSAEVAARATSGPAVRLLWDVCRIPDFRGISHNEHASLLEAIFGHLHERGQIPDDWIARQVKRIDNSQGDIDAIAKRLAYIRTWTYVAQRNGWTADNYHWRDETRAVEDRLSDALHERLMQRFVDRRTSVLLRRLGQKEAIVAEVSDTGEVTVEGEFVGRLEGFRFTQDRSAAGAEARTIRTASLQALAPHFHLRADRFYNAPDPEIDFTEQGGLMWGKAAVGKLVAGADPLKPRVEAFVDDVAGPEVAEKVQRRLQHFIDRRIAALFEPMIAMQRDETMTGLARGFAFRLVEALGVLPRAEVADEVKALDQESRALLRKHGVRFGQFTVFMPLLLKPAPTRLRLVLWSLSRGLSEFPEAPPPGLVTIPADPSAPDGAFTMAGYRVAGERAIRIDMLERLADMLRAEDSRAGFEARPDMLSITGMTLEQFAGLMQGLGYKADRGERPKVKPVDKVVSEEAPATPPVAETPTDSAQPVPDAADAAAPEMDATGTDATGTDVTGTDVTGTDAAPAVMDMGAMGAEMPEPDPAEPEAAGAEAAAAGATDEDAPDIDAPEIPSEGLAPVTAEPAETPEVPADIPAASEPEILPGTPADGGDEPETEVYYTFTWAGRSGTRKRGGRPEGQEARGKPRGGKRPPQQGGKGKGKGPGSDDTPRKFEARPPRKEKPIDPDSPFAALAALKGNK